MRHQPPRGACSSLHGALRHRVSAFAARRLVLSAITLFVAGPGVLPSVAGAVAPQNDPFYRYDDAPALADLPPGTPLRQRTVPFRVAGLSTGIAATQLLYRSEDMQGRPVVNATTVLQSPVRSAARPKVISYQSAYDSLNPSDQPSSVIAGTQSLGSALPQAEVSLLAPFLLAGFDFTIPDTEGQNAAFAAGPSYGRHTLYAIRATLAARSLAYPEATRVGLIGYSGGAIATEWAAELAPQLTPDVNQKLVGAAFGGVPVAPHRMLAYVDGSPLWAGVIPMALAGISREIGIALRPYASAYGLSLLARYQRASIIEALPVASGVTWAKLTRPEYRDPAAIPEFVAAANRLIMGRGATPTVPMYIAQGAGGQAEGTRGNRPGIGPGDGVTITGDVRWLARTYCERGAAVRYEEFRRSSHFGGVLNWLGAGVPWLLDRFAGRPAPTNCGRIPVGNDVQPLRPAVAPST